MAKKMTMIFFQLIACGQVGRPVDHVLKAVIEDNKNIQDTKQEMKGMADIVQVLQLKTNGAIRNLVQVRFFFHTF